MLGPCRKRQSSGMFDGCGLFEPSSNDKICEACGCHRSFHIAPLDTGSGSGLPSIASSTLSSPRPQIIHHPHSSTSPIKRNTLSPQPVDTFTVTSTSTNDVPFLIQRPIPVRPTINIIPFESVSTTDTIPVENKSDNDTKIISFPEYPDGDITIDMIAHSFDDFGYTGWSTYHQSKWTSSVKQSTSKKLKCMGVLCCTYQDCGFVRRPSKKYITTKEIATCRIHDTPLQHLECNATLIWKDYYTLNDTNQPVLHHSMTHRGVHGHPKPPPIRPPPSRQFELKQKVLHAPSTRPKQLLTGNPFTESVREIHPSLSNLDRLAYMRRSLLKEATVNASIMNIFEWQKKHPEFITSTSVSITDGHLFLQTDTQRILCTKFQGPIQTDAIESFVDGPENAVLCVSSGYIESLDRIVPLCFTIIFGKTEYHYRTHFNHLFKSLNMVLQTDIDEINDPTLSQTSTRSLSWSCMVMDFSTAQHLAFLHEFKLAILQANKDIMDADAKLMATSYVRGCQIHYFRSVVRVARIVSVIPSNESSNFVVLATELVNCDIGRFVNIVTEILSKWPKCNKWLNWYLQEDRAKLIFKCHSLLGDKWSNTVGNTNAQEGTGKDIKFTATSSKLKLFDVVDHLYRYAANITADIDAVTTGSEVRYKRKKPQSSKKSKKVFVNDGRPPDTAAHLTDDTDIITSKTPYQLAYRANVLSQQSSDAPSSSYPSKYSFLKNNHSSCYCDSPLFILYNIFMIPYVKLIVTKLKLHQLESFNVLLDVIDMIKQKKYSKASHTMLQYVWSHPEGGQKDSWYSFVKFFIVFFDNKLRKNDKKTLTYGGCQNILGITYLVHTYCPNCGYNNKMVYNSIFECHSNQLRQQDMVSGDITADTIINYRHHHSHEVSSCTSCLSERYQWYTIVDVPLIFVLNMEGIRTDKSEDITCTVCPPDILSVDTVTGTKHYSAWGQLNHHPGHWTAWSLSHVYNTNESLCTSKHTYYYNDVHEKVVNKKFTSSLMSQKQTTAVFYVRHVDGVGDDHETCAIPLFKDNCGRVSLHCYKSGNTNIAEGYVIHTSIHGVCIVFITSVQENYASLPCPFLQSNRQHEPKTLGACINVHVAWESQYMTLYSPTDEINAGTAIVTHDQSQQNTQVTETVTPSEPTDYAIVTNTSISKPTTKKKRKAQTNADFDDTISQSSSFNLDVQRAKSRSRREAKQLK